MLGASSAFWNGCSQGGPQGITGAAKYPSDSDGIVAGALALTGCASSSPVWSSTCSPSGVNASIREAR